MTRRVVIVSLAFLSAGLMFTSAIPAQQPDQRDEVVRALLRHSRPLTGARVEIPAGVYHRYLRELHAPERPESDAPVPYIAESGTYHLTVGADQSADLKVKICLRVFDPWKCLNIPILGTKNVIWEDLAADDKGAILTTTNGWIRFTAPRPGLYTITGRLRKAGATWRDVIPTVRTAAVFDSPGVWEVQAEGQVAGRFVGTAEKGTHGRFALKPTNKIRIKYTRPRPRRARPPIYSLQGDVAWNLGAAAQQITASLKATIAAGASDQIVLLLPDGADRVKITGPEVRKVQVGSGRAVVHLRGKILGTTLLKVSCELPASGPNRRLGRFGVANGRWSGGTLVVTNSAGGSEILPASMTGLRRMSLSEVPPSASAILPAPAVLAYEITSRDFSAEVEVLQLGRFALRQSIVDLAHYEVFLARDGAVICRARYEIRNSNKQFLRLKLPAGAQVLLARVNEKSRPLSPATGRKNTWLLPLERSRASVMGLVSFPAEVVFLCRTAPMGKAGVAEIPLPGIDLPIAYAWCETYVPEGLDVAKWSGVMKKVSRFSSETAKASLDYGWGELAEGYTGMDRPTTPPAPKPIHKKIPIPTEFVKHLKPFPKHLKPVPQPDPTPQPTTRPTTQPGYVASLEREMGVPSRPSTVSRLVADRAKVRDADTYGYTQGIQGPKVVVTTRSATPILARNYYRTGKDYYDKADYAEAARYLEQVAKLAPGSAEARNARRLLANPQMPKARELETKAEKAAARIVQREVEQSNITLTFQQLAYIKSGKAAAREGRHKEATAKLKAAQAVTEQLIARGAGQKETIARMQQAQPEMEQLREQTTAEVGRLRKQMKQLEKQKKYGEALKVAGRVRKKLSQRVESRFGSSHQSIKVLQEQITLDKKEVDELRRKMDALAASASRKRQKQAKGKGMGKRDRIASAQDARTRPQRRPTGSGGGGGGAITRLDRTRHSPMQQAIARERIKIEQSRRRREIDWGRLPLSKMAQERREKIARLKERACTLRDEQKYRQTIKVCDEILKLDPDDAWAKKWHARLSRFVQILDARDAQREEIKRLNDVRWSQVPWHTLMNYPDDWSDITRRRKPMGAGEITESKANRVVRRRLMQTLPQFDISGVEFKDVVQFLREVSNVSIHVKWAALEQVGVTRESKVNVNLTNVTLNKTILTVLDDVSGPNPLGFVLDEGVITITTRDDLSSRTVTRVYDIRDLVVRVPNFKGPSISLRRGSGNNNNNGDGSWGDDDDDDESSPRQEMTNDVLDLIRSTIDPNTWRQAGGKHGSIREMGGQIIVTNTAENQKALMDLLVQLRRSRGPQVEEGKKIAQQRAANLTDLKATDSFEATGSVMSDAQVKFLIKATEAHRATRTLEAPRITIYSGQRTYVTDRDGGWRSGRQVRIKDRELDSFIRRNYDWALQGDPLTGARIPDGGTLLVGGLISKLRFNRGQKVVVNSLNVNADARAAAALGVRFKRGGNNVNWSIINEAQFRTLMELDAELTRRSGRAVAANDRLQETIVGTDARLSNEMIANITFAGDKGNMLNISGNTINLAHEGYLLLSDGGHLTVVRAGAMQHWREKPADVQFVEVPQNIEVPRVGQLFRFERTLLEPSDQMVLRVEYKQKGASK